jgi:hypothetical protein
MVRLFTVSEGATDWKPVKPTFTVFTRTVPLLKHCAIMDYCATVQFPLLHQNRGKIITNNIYFQTWAQTDEAECTIKQAALLRC